MVRSMRIFQSVTSLNGAELFKKVNPKRKPVIRKELDCNISNYCISPSYRSSERKTWRVLRHPLSQLVATILAFVAPAKDIVETVSYVHFENQTLVSRLTVRRQI